jgi:hypothetical protein
LARFSLHEAAVRREISRVNIIGFFDSLVREEQ